MALSFVLLTTAGLLIQSFFRLQQRIGTGFNSTNVLTARLPIPSRRFADPDALNAYLDRIADRIQTLPGVRDVAFTEGLPTQGTPFSRSFQIADQPPTERAMRPMAGFKTVSPSYFRTLGLRLIDGRALSSDDRRGAPLVVVINETDENRRARTPHRELLPPRDMTRHQDIGDVRAGHQHLDVGIRMSLGARAADVFRMFVRESLSLALIGVAIGLGPSAASSKLLTSFLFGLTATDAMTFIGGSTILCFRRRDRHLSPRAPRGARQPFSRSAS